MAVFKETLNKMGYQALQLDEYSKRFVELAVSMSRSSERTSFLEVGCGFGLTALELLQHDVKVCCNDICLEHLDSVEANVPSAYKSNFSTMVGDIRELNSPEDKFSAILCSRVLHFYSGEDVIIALKNMHKLLKRDGFIVVIVETPFLKNWQPFIPQFYRNKRDQVRWPGVAETKKYETSGRAQNLPEFMHFFDIDTLVMTMVAAGFTVNEVKYIARSGLFPDDLLLDGRESVAVVATKL